MSMSQEYPHRLRDTEYRVRDRGVPTGYGTRVGRGGAIPGTHPAAKGGSRTSEAGPGSPC